MSWEKRPLEDVADFCLGKMLDQRKNKGDLLPYLANVNVRWGEFELDDLREMRFEQHEMDRFGLQHGDIVMCEGGEPGRCAIWKDQMPGMMFQKALHRIRPKEQTNSEFLFYSLRHKGKSGHLAPLFTGATIKHLPREKLALVEVVVPSRPVQDRIAGVLSAYDGLIENNRRRMALLEEAARQLYREWFARLRFPGHEHTRIIDGVPEGWGTSLVSDFGEVITGKTPSTKEADNYGGDVPFIKTPDMHGNIFVVTTEAGLTEKGANTQPRKFVLAGSLLVSCIGTVGVVAMTSARAQFNQQINAVVPFDAKDSSYLFFALRDMKQTLEAIGGGATMANVSKSKFANLEVLQPSKLLLREFHDFCVPSFQQVQALSVQNLRLRTARDLLLPRLMNGEIAV